MSTHQPPDDANVVIATVRFYDWRKKLGNARIDATGMKVRFHNRARRVIKGTADKPVITESFDARSRPIQFGTKIVLIVADKSGGQAEAAAWGIRPPIDWRAELINDKALESCVGGQFESKRGQGPTFNGPEYIGRLQAVMFRRNDAGQYALTVTLTNPQYRNDTGTYVPMPEEELQLEYIIGRSATRDKRNAPQMGYLMRLPRRLSERLLIFRPPT